MSLEPSVRNTSARGLSATAWRLVTNSPGLISTALAAGSKDATAKTRDWSAQTALGVGQAA